MKFSASVPQCARLAFAAALLAFAASPLLLTRSFAEPPRAVTASLPAVDAAPGGAASEVAVLAGGCFWGVQGVF